MLKKIREKRIEQFKKDFPDFKVAKKTGSLYIPIDEQKIPKTIKYNGRAITKGTINKLGTFQHWDITTNRRVYLMSPKGRLMIKYPNKNFKSVTLKSLRGDCNDLSNVFFIGKKYEWLKDYGKLQAYKFFQGFNSLGEAKKFLGYSFISDEDFVKCFSEYDVDALEVMILAKEKKNAVNLLKDIKSETIDILRDYISMCQDNGLSIEIPAGKNKLEELHDSARWEINKMTAEYYSKEYRYGIKEDFTEFWKESGLVFRRLETPYEMYTQGLKQHHCIGTNYAKTLHQYAFYTFTFEDNEYDMQIYRDGTIGQFYGRKNCSPPESLREKIKQTPTLKFQLEDTKPGLDNYPMIKEGSNEELIPF